MATPNSQLAAELWPQILRRLERWQRNVGTGGGGSGTVTVEFTGTVTDAMAPQFVLRDGSRSLQGNLAVDAGVTIDGVDISAHAADASAHHAPVTSGDGIGVTGQSVAVDSTVVRTSRTLTAGDGLGGGGDLSANRSFAVDSTVVRTSRTLTAGIGITGGGTLAADRTFAVDQGFAPTWTGIHTFNARPVISNNLLFNGAARTILTSSGHSLTLAPVSSDLIFNPGGVTKVGAGKTFRSDVHTSAFTGIAGFEVADLGGNYYQMTIGGLKVDELYARTFVSDETRVDRGSQFWSKSFGVVETAFVLPALESTVDVWFEDAASMSGNIFAVNDWLLCRTVEWGTSLTLSLVWFQITALVTASSGGRQRWRLRRKAGGTTGQTINAKATMIDVGVAGQGVIELSALTQDKGPFIRMGNWATNPSVPGNWTHRVQMGNLEGVAGYGLGKWGFAAGKNLGASLSSYEGILIEKTDGAALHNTAVRLYDGGSEFLSLSVADGIKFSAPTSYTDKTGVTWYRAAAKVMGLEVRSGYTAGFTEGRLITQDTTASSIVIAPMGNAAGYAAISLYSTGHTGTAPFSGGWIQIGGAGTPDPVLIKDVIDVRSNKVIFSNYLEVNAGASFTGNVETAILKPSSLLVNADTAPVSARLYSVPGATSQRAGLFKGFASMTVPVLDVHTSGGTSFLQALNSGHVYMAGGLSVGNANYTKGVVNVGTGFRIANAAAAGSYLRGNGTNFVSSGIQVADIPSGSGHYIRNTTTTQAADLAIDGNAQVGTLGTAWTNATLAADWSNLGGNWPAASYMRFGTLVCIRGIVTATAAKSAGATIFTLPSGFRPTGGYRRTVVSKTGTGVYADLDVYTTGAVVTQTAIASGEFINLDVMFIV